jgi:hypothetical protein
MNFPRRQFLHLVAGAGALPALPRFARAQAYPSRAVRIVVGLPAGGNQDVIARLIAPWLSERLGQQIINDNHPSGSNNIAAEAVIRSPPDGYTALGGLVQRDQRDALRQAWIRHAGHGPGRQPHPCAQRAGGASIRSGQSSSRVHRLRQRPIPANSTCRLRAVGPRRILRESCLRWLPVLTY